jgi:flagellar biosynthesis/type III secretory pathway chaperone
MPGMMDEVVEPTELLVELLRSEAVEYGGLLALLEDQQKAVVERAPNRVVELNTAITDQMRVIQMRREAREKFIEHLAITLKRSPDSSLCELLCFFRQPIQPLIEALIAEINHLVTRARRRAQQNEMLLGRSIEVMQGVLHRLNPETMQMVYGSDGRSFSGIPDPNSVGCSGRTTT